ncbi:helix-turn-helix domain-containing protein [Spongiimicrobium sp. 2-473A-2-J]|uniref:helix-turn-helix domain-containing protein n=1 Tax=Eudoraea algarum TaxID=3417568 RepID=UPI003D366E7A
MWPSIINALALTAAIILVFILSILPARKGDRNLYLLILLAYLVVHLMGGLLMVSGVMELSIYALFSLSMVVLYGPTFYHYMRKFHGLPTRGYLWHIVPVEAGLWSLFLLHGLGILETPRWFYNLYYATVLLVYFIAALKLRWSVPLKQGKDWMRTITLGFGGLIVLYLAESIWMSLNFDSVNRIVIISTTIYNLFCFVFLLISIKQIITKPEAFSNMRIRIPYKNEKIKNIDEELALILAYVLHQKEYKNPDLNRNLISEATGLGVHRISEIINSAFEKNFNDWINDHRISEAKTWLMHSELSIKEICYEVGFNSKSAFNQAFKKRTQTTPSEYRLEQVKSR